MSSNFETKFCNKLYVETCIFIWYLEFKKGNCYIWSIFEGEVSKYVIFMSTIVLLKLIATKEVSNGGYHEDLHFAWSRMVIV